MSKSIGNVVDPVDIAKRLGGEIVRLWVASVDFREDVHASEELMQRVAENYRKIRNTFKNMLGNLYDFNPQDAVPFSGMDPLDQYFLLRTAEMSERVQKWYDERAFHRIYQEVHSFCASDLSNIYFDVLKDRLYTSAPNSRSRRSAQTAMWRIAEGMVRLIAPIISFTADEIWQYLPQVAGRAESVHLTFFPKAQEIFGEEVTASVLEALNRDWAVMMSVRDEALKALEAARNSKQIGPNLEAHVKISAPQAVHEVLSRFPIQLRALLIVSGISLEKAADTNGSSGVHVEVTRAAGPKCERCWNYSVHVGENKQYPMICERCSIALQEIDKA
jgi:isoleucyl-tRNA synthetase